VRERVLTAFNNQDVPFEQIVQALESEYNLDRISLFQVLFILQNAPMEPLRLPGLTVSLMSEEGALVEPDTALTTFDLILMMEEGPQGLIGLLRYKKDLFHDDTINRMLMNFQIVLESIVSEPDQRISTVPLVSLA
jgi:non-ribosomal peptide synthetase component F